MVWLVLVLTALLVLVALVIALGTRSTKIYAQARQGQGGAARSARSIGGGRTI